jgi:hypothetical protein
LEEEKKRKEESKLERIKNAKKAKEQAESSLNVYEEPTSAKKEKKRKGKK